MNINLTRAAAALVLGLSSGAMAPLHPVLAQPAGHGSSPLWMAPITPALAQTAGTEAALKTSTFTVENMTCATCPITVRLAMEGVEGVRSVEVDFEAKSATVVFDPAVTDPGAIAAASTNAGYPAAPAGGTPEERH